MRIHEEVARSVKIGANVAKVVEANLKERKKLLLDGLAKLKTLRQQKKVRQADKLEKALDEALGEGEYSKLRQILCLTVAPPWL
jgi:hypothetical protein